MRQLTALLTMLMTLASPAVAAVRPCTSALVTAGLCNSTSDVLVSYSLSTVDPDGAGPRVAMATQFSEGCAITFDYQAIINGVANPETKSAFCDRVMKSVLFKSFADRYYNALAEATKQQTIVATPADIVP